MRKFILLATSLILATGFSLSALAQDTSSAPSGDQNAAAQPATAQPAAMTPKHHHSEACGKIFSACKAAGFSKNGTSGKHMWKDCIKPTLLGQSVPGVTADPKDIQTCKTRLANKMRKQAAELSGANATDNAAPSNSSTSMQSQ